MKKDAVDSAILIVLIAGIFWSFGALVVRFIEDAQSIPWQYLFFRGFTIFLLINFFSPVVHHDFRNLNKIKSVDAKRELIISPDPDDYETKILNLFNII